MAEKKLRVLLVGSALQALVSPLNSACAQMQHALDLTSVSSLETMLAIVRIIPLDLVILDLSLALPGVNDALRLIHRAAPNVPLITFATAEHKEAACATVKEGAVGYLLSENLELTAITPLLSAALERNTVRGLVDLLRDSLTNLYTREGFQ